MKFELNDNKVKQHQALIYMWEIYNQDNVLVGVYVGKAKSGSKRPLKHYKRNIKRLLDGRPYRKSNPNGYRKVHLALAKASESSQKIQLTFLCNVSENENINEVESLYIKEKNSRGTEVWQLNG